jgi:hypothetical protein
MPSARDNGATRADTPSDPSRRAVLADSAAALLAGAAAVAVARGAPVASPQGAGDDAELLRLRQELVAQTAVLQLWNDDKISEEEGAAADKRWWEIVHAMWDMKPVTSAGVAAKAAAAHLVLTFSGYSSGGSDDFAWDALAQIAAWGGMA